jgi:mono/diheme cytochrome c family protein
MRTYATWCRSCHGLRARGDGVTAPPGAKPANLVDAEWKYGSTDAEIFRNIRQGIKPFEFMKPQKELTDTEIWNIINYLRSLAQEPKK